MEDQQKSLPANVTEDIHGQEESGPPNKIYVIQHIEDNGDLNSERPSLKFIIRAVRKPDLSPQQANPAKEIESDPQTKKEEENIVKPFNFDSECEASSAKKTNKVNLQSANIKPAPKLSENFLLGLELSDSDSDDEPTTPKVEPKPTKSLAAKKVVTNQPKTTSVSHEKKHQKSNAKKNQALPPTVQRSEPSSSSKGKQNEEKKLSAAEILSKPKIGRHDAMKGKFNEIKAAAETKRKNIVEIITPMNTKNMKRHNFK